MRARLNQLSAAGRGNSRAASYLARASVRAIAFGSPPPPPEVIYLAIEEVKGGSEALRQALPLP